MLSVQKHEHAAAPRLLILGIGNEIRCDDGIGLVVADRVRKTLAKHLQNDVEVRTLNSGGLDIIYEVEGFDELIVVDSYFAKDSVPGRVRTLSENDLSGALEDEVASAHLISLPTALQLSTQIGYKTPILKGIVVVDVGDNCMTFGEGLTPKVAASADQAAKQVCLLVERQ